MGTPIREVAGVEEEEEEVVVVVAAVDGLIHQAEEAAVGVVAVVPDRTIRTDPLATRIPPATLPRRHCRQI
jgi:hypothetical protein